MEQVAAKISDAELDALTALWDALQPLPLAQIRQNMEHTRNWDSSTIKPSGTRTAFTIIMP